MTKLVSDTPTENAYMAEGSTPQSEDSDPSPTRQTTLIPTVNVGVQRAFSETGLIEVVNMSGEGKDDDDIQDAALTSGEEQSDTQAEAEAQTETATDDNPSRPYRVLIVEDTTELAEVIQATLERLNIQTEHVTHGSKAMDKYVELDPDVVLLDISLPDTTGWKIMDLIKERLEATKGHMPKVIIITAYDDPANRLIGKLQGVHNYLIKPFTSDQIEQLVSEALDMDTPA
jgi:CheY-like chemotaxis protein